MAMGNILLITALSILTVALIIGMLYYISTYKKNNADMIEHQPIGTPINHTQHTFFKSKHNKNNLETINDNNIQNVNENNQYL